MAEQRDEEGAMTPGRCYSSLALFFEEALGLSTSGGLQGSTAPASNLLSERIPQGQAETKLRGTVIDISPLGSGLLEDEGHQLYSFRLKDVEEYRGERLHKFGLTKGAEVLFIRIGNHVAANVEVVRRQKPFTRAAARCR